jgi:Tol biopolymer transport system component/C-terminal processing protease CtpA/Prc
MFLKSIFLFAFCIIYTFSQAQENPLWLRYPAISPDGQTIVFSYKGDLYRVPSAGGLAVPITLHEAHDFMPVWSKDGKSIAFASDRYGNFDVFVMPATGGEAKRLTFHSANDFPTDFTPDNQRVIFQSSRLQRAENMQFPRTEQLYSVSVNGGQAQMLLDLNAEHARFSPDGSMIVYQDWKGYEDKWRKHHTSSVTRDIWIYNTQKQSYQKISTFEGEDRNPIFSPDGKSVYFLSEKSGTLNIWQTGLNGENAQPITTFEKHPVRFLSQANNGTFCFSWNGEIYTLPNGGQARKVPIQIATDSRLNTERIVPISGGISEMALSPNGKEVAFIFRGEVFVSALQGGITKRITNTPEQERSVSFSPDGRSLVYAGERNGSWNIYQSTIISKDEAYFFSATLLKEEALIATNAEEFQPQYSPDGKEIAYLEERTTLKVYNIASKSTRTVLAGTYNYSYSDGDQYFAWSPDSQYLLATFVPKGGQIFMEEIALVKADGKSEPINLTQSGYDDGMPKWVMDGKAMIWTSDRDGMKNHASWGGERDVYAMFFDKATYDRFLLSKEELEILKEKEKETEKEKKEKETASQAENKRDKKAKTDKTENTKNQWVLDLNDIENRKVRLTIHSARLADAVLSKDGEKLYYLARFEKDNDLWVTDLRTKETKILAKNAGNAMELSKDGKFLLTLGDGNIYKIDVESGKKETISIRAEMNLNYVAEKSYIFDHAWRQVVKKFYVTDLHKVDWEFYYKEYKRFLPHINNNYDFSEMLSELLGELNASHTGCRFSPNFPNGDNTASLGVFYDDSYQGNGVKIAEIIAKSPLDNAKSRIKAGMIIEKIDGVEISPNIDFYSLLNRKAGKNTLLSAFDPNSKQRFDEVVKPISRGEEAELIYRRWVARQAQEVEKLSGGKVGYVHVRGMNDPSYRTVVEDVLGKHIGKEALIVDTRFNGGGWLHDDLATFLSGKKYMTMMPRGQAMGKEPMRKWSKPSAVLMSEGNYSDAHLFPVTYKAYQIGKTIGMPVPGTGTAVWWETQIDNTLVFGIPQVGMVDNQGKYMENNQLEPDIKIANDPAQLLKGKDQQLERAVKELLSSVGK